MDPWCALRALILMADTRAALFGTLAGFAVLVGTGVGAPMALETKVMVIDITVSKIMGFLFTGSSAVV